MKIYADYTEEPEDIFDPLPSELYRQLYDLEMGDFQADLPFYLAHLKNNAKILELGCGSGRLSRLLSTHKHRVTGIDLSMHMLQSARQRSSAESYICMDMRKIRFSTKFDAVIIPYNTLNLMSGPDDVQDCLKGCAEVLAPGGLLLLQVYTLSEDLLGQRDPQSTFQFQMFDRPGGGKIVKEIKRIYSPDQSRITMTEQYKIRPMTAGVQNANYSQTLHLKGWSRKQWLDVIELAGFGIKTAASSYEKGTGSVPGLLLVTASSREE